MAGNDTLHVPTGIPPILNRLKVRTGAGVGRGDGGGGANLQNTTEHHHCRIPCEQVRLRQESRQVPYQTIITSMRFMLRGFYIYESMGLPEIGPSLQSLKQQKQRDQQNAHQRCSKLTCSAANRLYVTFKQLLVCIGRGSDVSRPTILMQVGPVPTACSSCCSALIASTQHLQLKEWCVRDPRLVLWQRWTAGFNVNGVQKFGQQQQDQQRSRTGQECP